MTSLIINSTILPPTDNEIANEEHEDYEYHHVTHPPIVSSLAHVFNPFHAASEKTSGRIKFLILQSGIETERGGMGMGLTIVPKNLFCPLTSSPISIESCVNIT